MIGALAAAFGAGLLASVSPCVYPLLPITLGFLGAQGSAGKGRPGRIAGYAFGQAATLIALGWLAVSAGETLGFSSEDHRVRLAVGALLLAAGAISWIGRLPSFVTRSFARLRPRQGFPPARSRVGVGSAALLGAGSALVASPCTSPMLGGVLALLATQATVARGLAMMTAYATGFTSLFLILGMGLARLPRAGSWLVRMQRAGAVSLAVAGAWLLVT